MERMLEERLRERVCLGDADGVQDLLNLGVNVNAREPVSGWTALHWACKEGHLDIVALLLKNGADKNLRSETGETAAAVCTNQQILYLLGTSGDFERIMYDSPLSAVTSVYAQSDYLHTAANSSKVQNNVYDKSKIITSFQDGLIQIDIIFLVA
ncbi:ankyrin repeat domain-containing protein 40-like [Pogonomyrmex barbatus]|uniref:Ankyrin repeat domain-containing protein 40-like n=1 Tax=Pogonomyrmex barbatus TaxID=144034 RepID=A0A6I9WS05_9HYME|nr:ankyrin repeat domain-containing protein 40-like [Pogonomyrmex barbatus]XP_011646692.1 ankyrin repeat domain-containing protein 40-like [Pogonomyrmex barbatus]